MAGFVPLVGEVPDLINGAIYALRGKGAEAALSVVSAVPGWGDMVAAGRKLGKFGARAVEHATEKALFEGASHADDALRLVSHADEVSGAANAAKRGLAPPIKAPKRGLTALGGSPNKITASTSEVEALVGQIKQVAQSATFVRRAKALGFTREHLAKLIQRIDELHASGNIGFIAHGGWIDDAQLLIGRSRFFRSGRIRHELGHLLDDIRSPGLLARASATHLSTLTIAQHEMVAFGIQLGRFNPIRPYGSIRACNYFCVNLVGYVICTVPRAFFPRRRWRSSLTPVSMGGSASSTFSPPRGLPGRRP